MMQSYNRILLHIVVPILTGTTVYALWRGIYLVDMHPLLASRPPDWIIYNLPDGLWLYALLSSIIFIWKGNLSHHFFLWLLTAVFLTFLTEVMQVYGLLLGTFDWNDIIAYLIAVTLSGFQFHNKMKDSFLTLKFKKMKLTRNFSSAISLTVFALLFGASATQKPIERISSSNVTYEKLDRATTPTPYETSYELPALKAVEQTKQDQVKGGVMVSCEVTSFEATKNMNTEKEIVTASQRGYDTYKIGTKIKYEVTPDDIWFNIKIKNNQDRILKLKDVAIVMLIDGVAFNIPDEAKQEWVGGMLVKGFEKTQKIKGPLISGLGVDKVIYVSINDVPTAYNPAGEILKKENFEWYYQVTKQRVTKQEMVEYTYKDEPIYKETCSKCHGGGKESFQSKCSKCQGTKQLKYTDYVTKKTWIGNCTECSGNGYITSQVNCDNCNGKGQLEYPKSPQAKITSKVTWTGWKVDITTNPAGSAVNVVDPKTGQYTYAGVSNGVVNWFSSNTSTSESFPITLEYQGKKYKVLPYDAKGSPSSKINVNFLDKSGVTVKGGKIVN